MKKDAKTIVEEINQLVSELAALAGMPTQTVLVKSKKTTSSGKKDNSGATGGIRLLAEEGKLDPPKQLSEIMNLLKQDGRHYGKSTVAMGLVNLVRERVLTRFKADGDKNWKYAVRK